MRKEEKVGIKVCAALILLSFVLAPVCQETLLAGPADEKAALESAGAWLGLVDSTEYDKSWDQAAAFFKGAVAKAQWFGSLQGVRKPLGAVISRQIVSAKYTTNLPGAPDGHYVVIQYNTAFENKKSAVETVIPMLDKDGSWRVSGYFIK
ncbi:MAG: DUF4019 domain-containing protein [Desulfomonile tiedjei]|uniref:DUF4019 domain-containing protein n=1 Tax=Desulfomonile tiedjei TaxID=2358 RepID=A0A9D6UYS0_9BACT|nr:DUF4019 domain-containing protein [Desulfomonile tiedjei]